MAELVIIDVGHGSASLLVGDEVVVVDAGPGSALLEYLDKEGIGEVAAVYVSHADTDHIKGVIALLGSGRVRIRALRLNSDSEKDTETWRDLQYDLDDYHRRGAIDFEVGLTEGDMCPQVAGDVTAEVVAPRRRLAGIGPGGKDKAGNQITTNSISAVIRVSTDSGPVALLTGDLDLVGLDHLIDTGQSLAAPILVFPHHGGHASRRGTPGDDVAFATRLMDAVRPSFVVLSIGRGTHETPRPEIMDVVREHSTRPRIACTQLSERCSAVLPPEDPTHLADRYAAGRATRKCCAGTVVVAFSSRGYEVLPAQPDHRAFVEVRAASALCRGR
jgi:beta-lactamase superfamily II metal-dependent hydrolase